MTNGTEVKDTVTGLIWQRCALGQSWNGNTCTGTATTHTWQDALTQASSLGNDYRLPNIKELQSLVETACYSPAINIKIFPDTQSRGYWSASPDADGSNSAWDVDFYNGNAYIGNKNLNYSHYVRGVRASQ